MVLGLREMTEVKKGLEKECNTFSKTISQRKRTTRSS